MSCSTLKLKGCEIKGSTFRDRRFHFSNRDISQDAFSLKVRRMTSVLQTIPGEVFGNNVIFDFSALENYRPDRYILEYWADFEGLGTEMIALEEFLISSSPCSSCTESNNTNFSLEFPNEIIEYEVNVSIINIGSNDSVTWDDIENKPTQFLPTPHTHDWTEINNKPSFFSGNYSDLTGKPVLFSGNYSDLNGLPTLFSGSYNDLTNKPTLFSGNYNDLTNKPIIPAAQVNADWSSSSGVSQILNKPVLFSGAYSDLTGKPTLFSGNYSDLVGKPTLFSGAYADLTGKPTLFSGDYNDLTNKPVIPDYSIQTKISTATVLASIHNRQTLIATSNLTITVPTGLPDGFETAFIADGGNITFAVSGTVFKLNNSKNVLNSGNTAVIKKENGTTNFYLKGDLS